MAIRASIMGVVALVGALGVAGPPPALAAPVTDLCLSGHAPAGWLRPGGYCEIAGDLKQHNVSAGGGGFGGGSFMRVSCGCSTQITDLYAGGWHYHDNGGGNWTATNGGASYTYQYHADGTYTRTP